MPDIDSTRIRAEIRNLRARLEELESQLAEPEPFPDYCDPRCSSCRDEPCEYPGHCWEPYCVTRVERAVPEPRRGRGRRS